MGGLSFFARFRFGAETVIRIVDSSMSISTSDTSDTVGITSVFMLR